MSTAPKLDYTEIFFQFGAIPKIQEYPNFVPIQQLKETVDPTNDKNHHISDSPTVFHSTCVYISVMLNGIMNETYRIN